MRVGEACNRQVVIARRDETLLAAARLMRTHRVGDVVIVEERGGQRVPVGILTDRDVVVGVLAKDSEHLRTLLVGDVLSRQLIVAGEEDDTRSALEKMRTHGIRRLPVVNARGGLVGIITFDDILELMVEEMTELVRLVAQEQRHEREARR